MPHVKCYLLLTKCKFKLSICNYKRRIPLEKKLIHGPITKSILLFSAPIILGNPVSYTHLRLKGTFKSASSYNFSVFNMYDSVRQLGHCFVVGDHDNRLMKLCTCHF